MDVEFIMEVERRAASLDQVDYFQVLGVPYEAGPVEIRAAYHRAARAYHPDRFAALPSPELRELIGRVHRRVAEAYTVLRDDEKRRKYRAEVTGPERAAKLRFRETDELAVKEEQARKREEQLGLTPNGRKLYAAALREVEAQRWEVAERSIRTALVYEPSNARFLALLAAIEKSRPRADPFKIR